MQNLFDDITNSMKNEEATIVAQKVNIIPFEEKDGELLVELSKRKIDLQKLNMNFNDFSIKLKIKKININDFWIN